MALRRCKETFSYPSYKEVRAGERRGRARAAPDRLKSTDSLPAVPTWSNLG